MTSLPYDNEDLGMTAEELDGKYNLNGDGEHPEYTRQSWREAVGAQQTISGYWDWVCHQIATDDENFND